MKVNCAWCGKLIREVKSAIHDDRVSHGICAECAFKVETDWEATRISKWEGQKKEDVS
jgi:hypothetical protein